MGSKRMRKGATSLRGRRVVLTGALTSMTRAEAHAAIRAAGGITQDQVRKAGHRADLLVMGERPGSKLDVALACEIEIWGEGELLAAIGMPEGRSWRRERAEEAAAERELERELGAEGVLQLSRDTYEEVLERMGRPSPGAFDACSSAEEIEAVYAQITMPGTRYARLRSATIEAKPTADDTAPCEAAIELAQLVKRGAA